MPETLHVALIAGAMYDALYPAISEFTEETGIVVTIGFHGVHPDLNAHLASLEEMPYDLVSTHTKYAPSQRSFLAPLADEQLNDYYPAVLEMARIDGLLCGLPRNIDVKLLHYRHDLVTRVPETWDELYESSRDLCAPAHSGFVFTGKDSGLFGIFYELSEMGGARLFPSDHIPRLDNSGGRWALQLLRDLYRSGSVPEAVTEWQFEEAHQCFRNGGAAMICDWPGYYASYCDESSKVRGQFGLARMPAGPEGHKAYAGAHTFALTTRGINKTEAHQLLHFLTSPEQQLQEAHRGSVPVRKSVMATIRPQDSQRWKLLEQVIAADTLVPPRLAYYPEIEEILWRTVRSAITGELSVEAALKTMEIRIRECHLRNGNFHAS